jgi:hypothetical protein
MLICMACICKTAIAMISCQQLCCETDGTHIEVDVQREHDIANDSQERQEDQSSEHQGDDGRGPLLWLTLRGGA